MKYAYKPGFALLFAVIFMSLMVMFSPAKPAQALPPRPNTPTPTALSRPAPKETRAEDWLTGAYIHLQAATQGSELLWSVVQWQDEAGNWHNVEGWMGYTEAGEKKWWVAPKDFGKAPFRWAVYAGSGEEDLLGLSEIFLLPSGAGQETIVDVLLAP